MQGDKEKEPLALSRPALRRGRRGVLLGPFRQTGDRNCAVDPENEGRRSMHLINERKRIRRVRVSFKMLLWLHWESQYAIVYTYF